MIAQLDAYEHDKLEQTEEIINTEAILELLLNDRVIDHGQTVAVIERINELFAERQALSLSIAKLDDRITQEAEATWDQLRNFPSHIHEGIAQTPVDTPSYYHHYPSWGRGTELRECCRVVTLRL